MRGAEKPPALRAGGLGRASAIPLLDEGAELVGEPTQILVGAALVVGDDLHEPAAHILQALVGEPPEAGSGFFSGGRPGESIRLSSRS